MWQQLAKGQAGIHFFFRAFWRCALHVARPGGSCQLTFAPGKLEVLSAFHSTPNSRNSGCYVIEWTISIWSDQNIRDQLWRWSSLTGLVINVPSHLRKLSSPVPLFRILGRTITKCTVAWVWSVQPKCTISLSMWNFRNFKLEFLLNGKHPFAYIEILCWAPWVSQVQSSELPDSLEARHWS